MIPFPKYISLIANKNQRYRKWRLERKLNGRKANKYSICLYKT